MALPDIIVEHHGGTEGAVVRALIVIVQIAIIAMLARIDAPVAALLLAIHAAAVTRHPVAIVAQLVGSSDSVAAFREHTGDAVLGRKGIAGITLLASGSIDEAVTTSRHRAIIITIQIPLAVYHGFTHLRRRDHPIAAVHYRAESAAIRALVIIISIAAIIALLKAIEG